MMAFPTTSCPFSATQDIEEEDEEEASATFSAPKVGNTVRICLDKKETVQIKNYRMQNSPKLKTIAVFPAANKRTIVGWDGKSITSQTTSVFAKKLAGDQVPDNSNIVSSLASLSSEKSVPLLELSQMIAPLIKNSVGKDEAFDDEFVSVSGSPITAPSMAVVNEVDGWLLV